MTATVPTTRQRLVLQGISWDTYQSLARDLEAEPGKHLAYDRGTLEITMPLPIHERCKMLVGRFIEATTEETGTEILSLGSTTWSRKDLAKGIEPDQCYYIQNESAVRGKRTIDLSIDPPPDLAVEIDNTSSSLDRLGIYAALGVSEVWRSDRNTFTIYRLIDGNYRPQETSTAIPLLSAAEILHFLQASTTTGETSLIREFRNWVREKLASARQ